MLENTKWLTEEEEEYVQQDTWKTDFPNLHNTLTEPQFKISELGISARDASYWDKQGVLPQLTGRGAMRRYNLVQAIWIRFIPQMRSLGIGLPTIKKFKDQIMTSSIDMDEYIRSDTGRAMLRELAKLKGEEKEFDELITSGELDNIELKESVDSFYFLVMNTILFRKNMNFMIFEDGSFLPYSIAQLEKLFSIDGFKQVLHLPHYTISLEKAYNEVLHNWENKPFFRDISVVSEDELEVLEALRQPHLKSVLVKFSDGEIDLIEVAQEQKIELSTRFLDVISKHGFHTVTLKTRNGKPVHYENKIIKKIKRTG
tara:strand:+ start:1520 stop:2461 length:942 start_codon:yes stop_codon:yes gene_type:complete